MRANTRTAVVAIVSVLLTACGRSYDTPPAVPEPRVPPTPAAEPAVDPLPAPAQADTVPAPARPTPARPLPNPARTVYEVQLRPLRDSVVVGTAWLTTTDTLTGVTVELNSESARGVHRGHIHSGSCEEIGPAVYPLEPVTIDEWGTGSAASNVPVMISTILDGEHLIAFHEAGGDPGPPVVCGEIPSDEVAGGQKR